MGSRFSINNKGISLVEVIVATVILTIGMAAVARAFSQCANAVSVSSDVMKAVFLAEDRLEDWELKEALGLVGVQPKQMAVKDDVFNTGYSLEPVPGSSLYRLALEVSWERLRTRRSFALATWLR